MTFPDDEEWGRPVDGSGDFARVDQLATHLLIVYPRGYIENHPTRFSQPGKKSDVIVCDIVDLDAPDDAGNPGKVYRNAWLRQSQLIISLRPFIDKKVLGRIGKGISRNGMNPPWVISDAVTEPGAVDRARAWAQANPGFALSPFDASRITEPARQQAPSPGFSQNWDPQPQYQQPSYPQPSYPQQGYPQQPPPQQYPTPTPVSQQYQGFQQTYQDTGYAQQQPQPVYNEPPRFPVNGAGQQMPPPPQDQATLSLMRAERARRAEAGDGYSNDPPF